MSYPTVTVISHLPSSKDVATATHQISLDTSVVDRANNLIINSL